MISEYEIVEWTNNNKLKRSYHLFNTKKMRGIFEKGEYVKFFNDPLLAVQAQDVFEIERITVEYSQAGEYCPSCQNGGRIFLENCKHLKDNIRTALHIAGVPLYLTQPQEYRGLNVICDGMVLKNLHPLRFALAYRLNDTIKLTNTVGVFATIEFVGNMFFPENSEITTALTGTLWNSTVSNTTTVKTGDAVQ
ncbi:MAG: hypothetical protein NUV76_02500 [Candidatus Kuenenia sp.]|nr:hypothetical protein [Candidatus Kuenenia sp.]